MKLLFVTLLSISSYAVCHGSAVLLSHMDVPTTTPDPKLTCMERNAVSLWKMCIYNDQTAPCFFPNEFTKMKVEDISDLAILSSQLCFGRVPPTYLRRSFCCFSPECLKKCYGIVDDVQFFD
ncbi:hypothetical protein M3Y97_00092000 [Aphelenchoides bicaudatus]|nr:hypothetical protein M3Y97_00092000 [Aphelenchoides bicaudatus]